MSSDGNLREVYEQYWLHARHAEHETWLFTSLYAIIVAAIFAIVGSGLAIEIKISILIFGVILSILGFLIVYTLRIPFLKFALMSELIAINEFKIKAEYRRFFPANGKPFPKGKYLDLHDVLATFYSFLISIMMFILLRLYFNDLFIATIAFFLSLAFFLLSHIVIRSEKYDRIVNELKNKIIT